MRDIQRIRNSGIVSRAFSQYYVAYDTKAKEAAIAAKPHHQRALFMEDIRPGAGI